MSKSNSNYIRVFTGSAVTVLSIISALKEKNIVPVIKDDSESARLAGFGAVALSIQELFVHKDELDTAVKIIEEII